MMSTRASVAARSASRGTRARAEIADRESGGALLAGDPPGDRDQPSREQFDVEDVGTADLLTGW